MLDDNQADLTAKTLNETEAEKVVKKITSML
jgi:hypothetical protein